jgi:hypothetical protein
VFLDKSDDKRDARGELLEFLRWDEPDEARFAKDVRNPQPAVESGSHAREA